MPGARVIGVISGTAEEPRIAYLKQSARVPESVFTELGPLQATQVFRFAARCEEHRCGALRRPALPPRGAHRQHARPGGRRSASCQSADVPVACGAGRRGVPSLSSGGHDDSGRRYQAQPCRNARSAARRGVVRLKLSSGTYSYRRLIVREEEANLVPVTGQGIVEQAQGSHIRRR